MEDNQELDFFYEILSEFDNNMEVRKLFLLCYIRNSFKILLRIMS